MLGELISEMPQVCFEDDVTISTMGHVECLNFV